MLPSRNLLQLPKKTRASSARKRKETDSLATSETFPYENRGFNEASGFMTSFLNQGLERLMHLYEEACGLSKMLESKLKKAEVTIADQGMIAAAKSQHYEDKFKAVTQEAQTAIKKGQPGCSSQIGCCPASTRTGYELLPRGPKRIRCNFPPPSQAENGL
ncbi:hypothetical protein HanRHA438_Chr09g0378871 [Helianthus annuus]|uniref:Uncharacterized protein n=1 Tax=Helianthus annuus TaxID=4232 RepID=A0A9K3I373_HELAN|nr:hypothetical protein HanXRQr2_Chr09g0367731 [Helianthus annuus]KAJ0524631.1 hypothetical protein HanHA300_Chr09g0302701 [Helianthus annuus]KAJ0532408.1 hypothetical protein HanIR_Chr09g0396451 [Helianthus annuus]KAJ0540900.1 hypothetical protein HanHA89_Chr09g0322181 [Helianthus annuus]KAJ0705999.1 hypothetical protein HanLR1_Chr09g0301871 [Helianthus annuus]